MISSYINIIKIIKRKDLKIKLFFIIILALIQALLETAMILSLPLILKTLIFRESTVIKFFDFSLDLNDFNPFDLAIIFIAFLICKNIFILIYNFLSARYIAKIQSYLNTNIFSAHLSKNYESFIKTNSSEYIKNITHDSNNYINFSISPLITLIAELLILLTIFITLMIINVKLTILFLLSSSFLFIVYNFFTKNILLEAGKSNQSKQGNLVKYIKESYSSFKEIYLYNLQSNFIINVKKICDQIVLGISKNIFYGNLPRILIESFFIIFIILSLLLMLSYTKSDLIITFGTFGFAAIRLIPSLSKIFVSISSIKFGNSSCEILYKIMLSKQIKSEEVNENVQYNDSLKLVNVSHKYEEKLVLKNINLDISSKDFVAITGDSGSGKTTLLNIILGLITPTNGKVISNNFSVKDSPGIWQTNLGYVPQSINLIDDNIYKNIALGKDESLIDKEKIDFLLKSLSILDLSKNINEKEFNIGENSSKISGGQNQRIGIAKALYRDPKILVLDEFTSALDNENQEKIFKIIKGLNITVIMVTHRLDNFIYCNKVYQLKNKSLQQIK